MTWPQGTPQDPYGPPQLGGYPEGYTQPLSGAPAPAYYPYGYQPVARTNTLSILALVFAFVFPPAAIAMGHIAKSQIRQTGEDGDGLATAGLILGYLFTGLGLVFCCGYPLLMATMVSQQPGGY